MIALLKKKCLMVRSKREMKLLWSLLPSISALLKLSPNKKRKLWMKSLPNLMALLTKIDTQMKIFKLKTRARKLHRKKSKSQSLQNKR